ncbi:hypothetical protein [Streptomyces sp. NRRL S-340]|uniref:hypothetical protein n=1 Tax=Streptomyces sp. NRRL S-340 TaxID=1463901 RepID=UPI00068DBABD|nr:hypothetical protein [Streptomyces sp. NRRL S-340]
MAEEPWYNPVVIALTGMSVPLGSSERMYREAELPHRELVRFLDGLQQAVAEVTAGTAAGARGDLPEQYVRAMSTFASGDGADHVRALKETAAQLADAAHEFGYQLDYTLITIAGQVVLFLLEWAFTLLLMLIDPVEALAEQAALRAAFRVLLLKELRRLALEAAVMVGVNVALSTALDGLARWILAAQGKHTSQGAAYHRQSVVFGAIQGAIGTALPFATAGMTKVLAKVSLPGLVKDLEKTLMAGLQRPASSAPVRTAGEDAAHAAGAAPLNAVRGAGPVVPGSSAAGAVLAPPLAPLDGWFAGKLAAVVAPVAVSLRSGPVDSTARGLFRLRVETLFGKAFAEHIGPAAARGVGRDWAEAFLARAGSSSRDGRSALAAALGEAVRPLPERFAPLRTQLSEGVARALPGGAAMKGLMLLFETPLNAAHQNLSEGVFNVWLTGTFSTSGLTTGAGAAGFLVSAAGHHVAAPVAHWMKSGAHALGKLTSPARPPLVPDQVNGPDPATSGATPAASGGGRSGPAAPAPEPGRLPPGRLPTLSGPFPGTGTGTGTGTRTAVGTPTATEAPAAAESGTGARTASSPVAGPSRPGPSSSQITGRGTGTDTGRGTGTATTLRAPSPEEAPTRLRAQVEAALRGTEPAGTTARTTTAVHRLPTIHETAEADSPTPATEPGTPTNPHPHPPTGPHTLTHANPTDTAADTVTPTAADTAADTVTLTAADTAADSGTGTETHTAPGTLPGPARPAERAEPGPHFRPPLPGQPERHPAAAGVRHTPLGLPPYLRELRAPGLSTAYGLTGHEFVAAALSETIGRSDGAVAEIAADLAGRPETFYGEGRSFTVEGPEGGGWYQVTVSISRGLGDLPESFVSPGKAKAEAVAARQDQEIAAFLARREAATTGKGKGRELPDEPAGAPAPAPGDAREQDQTARWDKGANTKIDVQHNTSAAVSHGAGEASGVGAGLTAFGLAPVVPGVWLGAAMTANVQPFQTTAGTRTQRTVSEPRVLRSDKGSVEVTRQVRYTVRIERQGRPTGDDGQDGQDGRNGAGGPDRDGGPDAQNAYGGPDKQNGYAGPDGRNGRVGRDGMDGHGGPDGHRAPDGHRRSDGHRRPDGQVRTFDGEGTLVMRVPTEHLVPVTHEVPARLRPLTGRAANLLRLADSLAPFALDDPAASRPGGRELFDTVRSVLHPALTSPGAPGRARLHEATSAASLLEDLPRLLNGWVVGEDLVAKDGSVTGTYRMRAEVTGLAPAWAVGRTQLRTHQQSQYALTGTAGKGWSAAFGAGPAAGFGVLGGTAAVRATVMPTVAARTSRYTVTERTVTGRTGAEVRGDKALYLAKVRFRVEGTGPLSPAAKARGGARDAEHTMDLWLGLRADEARSLGLDLPAGMEPGAVVTPPGPEDVRRHLPFGPMGANVTLSGLDTRHLVSGVERLFADDPRLAGWLPEFGTAGARTAARGGSVSAEEAEAQRRNYRELVTLLSPAHLRSHKDQLLSSGINVRLRQKSRWHKHDVQIRVTGTLRETGYLGDTEDWLVRSHAGVAGSAQSGRFGARALGALALGQFRALPGTLSATLRGERVRHSVRRSQGGPVTRSDVLTNGDERTAVFGGALRLHVEVTMTTRERTAARALTFGSPGRDTPVAEHIASSAHTPHLFLPEQRVRLLTPRALTVDRAAMDRLAAPPPAPAPGAGTGSREFTARGIGDLSALAPEPAGGGRAVRDWTLVETVGDGRQIRELAFDLLARAAGEDRPGRADRALEAEGLAPRLAVEESLSARALTAGLRQAVSAGWVVRDLHHPRRLAELRGALGTRVTLGNPEVVAEGTGAGTETLLLGGHQASGQQGHGVGTTVQGGVSVSYNPAGWRLGTGLSVARGHSRGTGTATTLGGTVERNAHTPRSRPLYLVRCDLTVRMVAEVRTGGDRTRFATGGGTHVTTGERTLPGAAAVWLTAEQLSAAGLRPPGTRPGTAGPLAAGPSTPRGTDPAPAPSAPRAGAAGEAPPAQAPVPELATGLPLGFGMVEDLPDFVPLLDRLRADLGRRDQDLADVLLPRRQLADPHDNVQRLLRVLDRDGAAGLLSSAMDGGTAVELFRGRGTPYWAVFRVRRTGPGVYEADAADGRDMEYITSATAQRTDTRDTVDATTIEAVLAGAGKPDGAEPMRSTAAAAGFGAGSADTVRSANVTRGQLGVKTVAEASSRSVRMRVPVEATLEVRGPDGPVGSVTLGPQSLVHRIPAKDLQALARLRVVAPEETGQTFPRPQDADPAALQAWHRRGVTLPMEAQVNGFRGAPEIRRVIADTARAAHGGEHYGRTGEAAAYTQHEAVSTEWLTSALPLLTTAGADLPVAPAFDARGHDLHTSLHARLRDGRVLGAGEKMTFETVAQSTLDAPRPTGRDGQHGAEHTRTARAAGGAGLLNATDFRLNRLLAGAGHSGGGADAAAGGSGSMPLHKPKAESALVQFTLDVRVVARVSGGVRPGHGAVAVRDFTLPVPVVLRIPAPVAREMLRDPANRKRLRDPDGLLT